MAIILNALTTGVGGLETIADASGEIELQADGSAIANITTSGLTVTGTFNAGNLQVGGSDVLVDTDIGSTVQAYDADTTKNDVANTFTANQTINADLTVDTNTLKVDSTNNRVGIGTSSPTQKLTIITAANSPSLLLTDSTNSTLTIKHESGSLLTYETGGSATQRFVTNSVERMRITPTGNVGIDTSSPNARLEVVDSSSDETTPLLLDNHIGGTNIASTGIVFSAHNYSAFAKIVGGQESNGTFGNGNLRFFTRRAEVVAERMRITSTGNVGIGTSSPSAKLDVNGTIKQSGVEVATQNSLGVRNLIINGDMRIAQRGTSFAISTGAMEYGLDRWAGRTTPSTGLFTVSQSSDAPTGFQKSLLATVTSTYTPSGISSSTIRHYIEGYNTAHLDWGTANAKTVTLSFWVKSSVTGNFGGAFRNESVNYSYPFLYTVSSANTWEQISVTISGATSGSWAKTSGSGIQVIFSLGTGDGHTAPANSWIASDNHGADGQVQLIETSGATWQITGVQIEVGDTATPFEHRPFDMELARCMRYYEHSYSDATNSGLNGMIVTTAPAVSNAYIPVQFKVAKRNNPTMVSYDTSNNVGKITTPSGANQAPFAFERIGFMSCQLTTNTISSAGSIWFGWSAAAEL